MLSSPGRQNTWQQAWRELYAAVARNTPEAVSDRLDFAPLYGDCGEAQFDFQAIVLSWPVEGLPAYLDRLTEWLSSAELSDPEDPSDLQSWPVGLEWPPAEPPALWHSLMAHVPNPQASGFVAANILKMVALARAVQSCKLRSQPLTA